jgi:hypothetical protein
LCHYIFGGIFWRRRRRGKRRRRSTGELIVHSPITNLAIASFLCWLCLVVCKWEGRR